MTGLSRAEERRLRRKGNRDNARLVIAGLCVAAGVVLFVSVKIDAGTSAATPLGHGRSSSPTAGSPGSSGSTSPGSTPPGIAPLPIVSNGQGNGTGPAAFTKPDLVNTVMTAAKTGVEAVDSYDYRKLNKAIAAGLAATTGQFQTSYRSAMTGAVAATAPGAQTVQRCTVEKVGITSVSDDLTRASVLLFGRLNTTDSSTGATPRVTQITLGVTLDSNDGSWLISAVNDFSTGSGEAEPPGTGALFDATAAGAQEVVNLLSFTRANYDSDFGRALAGLTGPLLAEQESQRASILPSMRSAHADYLGEIRCIGIETVTSDSVILLVAATSYSVGDSGGRSVQSLPKLEIGITRINGAWLVDQFQAVAAD